MLEFRDRWLVHQDLYYRVAYAILRDEDEAMDTVQNLYVRLWGARDRLPLVRRPEAFGTRLVRNMCVDVLRRRNRLTITGEGELLEMDSGQSADRHAIDRDISDALFRAMEKMNATQRRVFRMKYMEGLDNVEIRILTGLSAVNIRVILSRSRSILKKILQHEK